MEESTLKNTLVTKLRIQGALATRVESSEIADGIPDIYMCYKGKSIFIEVKIGEKPKLRSSQYHWIKNHYDKGGLSYVLWNDGEWAKIILPWEMENLKTVSRSKWEGSYTYKCKMEEFNVEKALCYANVIKVKRLNYE